MRARGPSGSEKRGPFRPGTRRVALRHTFWTALALLALLFLLAWCTGPAP